MPLRHLVIETVAGYADTLAEHRSLKRERRQIPLELIDEHLTGRLHIIDRCLTGSCAASLLFPLHSRPEWKPHHRLCMHSRDALSALLLIVGAEVCRGRSADCLRNVCHPVCLHIHPCYTPFPPVLPLQSSFRASETPSGSMERV